MNRENIKEALNVAQAEIRSCHNRLGITSSNALTLVDNAYEALNQPAQLDGLRPLLKELFDELIHAGRDMSDRDRQGLYYLPPQEYFEDVFKRFAQRMSLQGAARPSKESIIKALYDCAAVGLIDGGVMMTRVFEKEADAILKLLNESPPIAEGERVVIDEITDHDLRLRAEGWIRNSAYDKANATSYAAGFRDCEQLRSKQGDGWIDVMPELRNKLSPFFSLVESLLQNIEISDKEEAMATQCYDLIPRIKELLSDAGSSQTKQEEAK